MITGLWTALLFGASVLWPVSYGYDEATHVDMAYQYSAHPFDFYGPGQLPYSVADVQFQHLLPGIPPRQPFSTAPIAARSDRPTLAQLGGPKLESKGVPEQMVEHPPLYYWLEAIVMVLPGVSHLSWDLELWLMRVLSVALMIPVPGLCWEAARRLLGADAASDPDRMPRHRPRPTRDPDRVALLAAVLPLTVPNLIRDGASVTNDALLVLATSVLLAMLARVVGGDLSRRTAGWTAVSLVVALWTKGFALVLPPIVLAAYVVGWRCFKRDRAADDVPDARPTIVPPLVICLVGALLGAIWWTRNLIVYGTVQINGYGTAFSRVIYGTPTYTGSFSHFIGPFFRGLIPRIWGGIGIPDQPAPGALIQEGWPIFVLIGIVAALVVPGTRGGRLRAWVLVAAIVLTLAVVADGSWSDFHAWPNAIRGNQGRYFYSVIVAAASVATVGFSRILPRRLLACTTPVVLLLAIATNADTWLLILRHWYQPVGHLSTLRGLADAVHGVLRWSPLPWGLTALFVFVMPVAMSLIAAAGVTWDSRRLVQKG
jgi:hypothetical protein